MTSASGCPGWEALNPVCQAGGAVSGLAGLGASAVFDGLSQWVAAGATWLLDQVGRAMAVTTTVDVRASWFTGHYNRMAAVAAVVALPVLLGAAAQAVLRQSVAPLARSALVHLPLALLLTGAATELVQLALAATDALSRAVASGSGVATGHALTGLVAAVDGAVADPSLPPFVLFLGALLVAAGAFALWLELLVRAASVYVTVLFLPMALASTVWPATAHWCRRLVDTLAALVLSKFVVVAILSLAVGAVAAGSTPGHSPQGFAAVLSGGALLLLASYSPFVLLKLVPMVEAGAVHHLEAARHRMVGAATAAPRSAASLALRHAGQPVWDPGSPGTGAAEPVEPPGGPPGRPPLDPALLTAGAELSDPGDDGAERVSAHGVEVPWWQGDPGPDRAFWEVMAGGPAADGASSGPGSDAGADRSPGAPESIGGPMLPPAPGEGTARPARPAWRDRHVVARDDMGPVIRWVPPAGDEGAPPTAGGQRD